MKAGLLAIAALSAAVSAIPHHKHAQLHEQRDVVVETAYATQVEYATVTAPGAVVYVDQDGNPINQAEPTPAPTPAPAASPSPEPSPEPAPAASSPAAPVVNVNAANGQPGVQRPKDDYTPPAATHAEPEAPATSAAPVQSAPAEPTQAASQPAYSAPAAEPSSYSPPATGGNGYGITYSPYQANGDCKSASQVKTDIDAIPAGYGLIRVYGTDCNQISNVLAAAKPHGYKLFLGIYDIDVPKNSVADQVQDIASAVNGDWSSIDTVSVGNEDVNNGKSVAIVATAVAEAKAALIAAGYTGPVVHVDTFVAIINNPALCAIGDYVAANCHAFFDSGTAASGAGEFVKSQLGRVRNACGGKKTVITETGWPSQGGTNGAAVPSIENQQTAIASLKSNLAAEDAILFSAYNEPWKTNSAGQFDAEHWWGIYGQCPSA